TVTLELSSNTYTLTNASAATPSVTIGEFQSHPAVTIQNGAISAVNTAVAIHPFALGTINLSNATYSNSGSMYVGGSSSASGGVGTVSINSSTLNVGGTLKVWNANSRVLFNSGSLAAGAMDVQAGQVILSTGGNKVARTGSVS